MVKPVPGVILNAERVLQTQRLLGREPSMNDGDTSTPGGHLVEVPAEVEIHRITIRVAQIINTLNEQLTSIADPDKRLEIASLHAEHLIRAAGAAGLLSKD